jgi:hypothetical protein
MRADSRNESILNAIFARLPQGKEYDRIVKAAITGTKPAFGARVR